MRRASVAAAGFALAEGLAADPGDLVHVSPGPDRHGRILLAAVEPLDRSPRANELATVALRALREHFAATPGSATEALQTAFAAANAAICAENRPFAGGHWERRVCVGATGIALSGREIVVAQAPPTQAILVQDGQVYAFPDVASWRGDYVPSIVNAEGHPLGFAEELTPRLSFSEAAVGDLIALVSTNLGRIMGRDEDVAFELHRGALLTGDLEGSVDRLERLLDAHDVIDAYAVIAAITKLPQQARIRRILPRPRAAAGERRWPPRTRPARFPVVPNAPLLASADAPRPAFEAVRDAFIRAAEGVSSPKRGSSARLDARQRALAAPGALSVSRYRESSGLPPEWRANLPRGPGVHVPARLLAVSFVLFLTVGGTGVAVGHQRDRQAQAATALAAADAALQSALENPGSATSLVGEATKAVQDARASGASGEALASRERELARVRDQIWGIERLSDVTRLGALPSEHSGAVRLAISGDTLYLAAGNLYELDAESHTLVTLLEEGDAVVDGTAGAIHDVSLDGGNVVASDGAATYVRDEAGRWRRHELAISDVGELREGVPVTTWGDATYALSWDGNIVRFEETSRGSLAETWATVEENPDLETARDFAIDGRINVLLADGRTLIFSRGALQGTLSPFVVPTLNKAAFLAQAPFATNFYIVDPASAVGENVGRIVRADASGNARQLLTPEEGIAELSAEEIATALASAQDMAVDELSGVVYWVSGNEVWKARLPRG